MRIAFYGDIHLLDRNYGIHIDYASESLKCYRKILGVCKENNVDIVVGTGDFTYKRFIDLGYRLEVESILSELYQLTKGNHMMARGNHDIASYGITERDYYIQKGLIKECSDISDEKVAIKFSNYGEIGKLEAFENDGKYHINLIHDMVDFKNCQLNNMGKAYLFEDIEAFKNTDLVIAGHLHHCKAFVDNVDGKQRTICYLGCSTRPAYEKELDKVGQVLIIDTDSAQMGIVQFDLDDISKVFNQALIEEKQETKEIKIDRERINEIVSSIADKTGEVNTDNIEDKIRGMEDISSAYRETAIGLIKRARES